MDYHHSNWMKTFDPLKYEVPKRSRFFTSPDTQVRTNSELSHMDTCTYIHTYNVHIYIHTTYIYIQRTYTYIQRTHTYIHTTYIYTYIQRTYLHTYNVHTYIHTYIWIQIMTTSFLPIHHS